MNLDEMSWEERFYVALHALIQMETRAIIAESLAQEIYCVPYKADPIAVAQCKKHSPSSRIHDGSKKTGPKKRQGRVVS
jgi:hypothetical protein